MNNKFEYSDQVGNRIFEFAKNIPVTYINNTRKTAKKIDRRKNGNVGEITGSSMNMADIDRGLPMRSTCSDPRKIFSEQSSRLIDFDIFNRDDNIKIENDVSYYDPNGNNIFMVEDNVENKITINNEIDSCEYLVNIANEHCFFIMDNIKHMTNKNVCHTPYSIFKMFIGVYLGSTGKTESVLKSYFGFPDKNSLSDSLFELMNRSDIGKEKIHTENYVILKKRKYNEKFLRYTSPLFTPIYVDMDYPTKETTKVNKMFESKYNLLFNNMIKSHHLSNDPLFVYLNVNILNIIWVNIFEKIVDGNFMTEKGNIKKKFMCRAGGLFHYYENSGVQVLELPYGNLFVGFVLNKNSSEITNYDYNMYLSNSKKTKINKIVIPKFKQTYQVRLNSVFQKTGLSEIFENISVPELVNDEIKINDIMQNTFVNIDCTIGRINPTNNIMKSNINFILNRPFTYYIRSSSKLILAIGSIVN